MESQASHAGVRQAHGRPVVPSKVQLQRSATPVPTRFGLHPVHSSVSTAPESSEPPESGTMMLDLGQAAELF
ncbi:hypothetical protein NDU88_012298 [Pleurodeles waltl]|uniref:Uncharacterized protein n=1 Tax=Pleurodeles waltl TaxID=8319 RepID=A0AAV7QZQ4_PLEWA|nr:hypothetical protein NDU88_012298 [Pleurodeles waltl]